MATHHTPDGLQLQVRLPAGRCEISTADTTETIVEAEPMNASSASRTAVECLVEKLRERPEGGHELRVEVPKHKRLLPGFGDAQVLIRIRGPHGLDLDAGTASADVVVTGRLGAANVRTASGDVSIEAAGATSVKTASGDVALGHMHDATDVKTMSGDVVVLESGNATDVNTMSGDVRIRRAAAGAIQVRSMSGDLEAAIAPGATLYVDATSASGNVSSELPVSGSAPGGPADVDLRATSMSGDILVTRAPDREASPARAGG
jgi:DUF4097 and DUF4098 domain-containing protein YvlB